MSPHQRSARLDVQQQWYIGHDHDTTGQWSMESYVPPERRSLAVLPHLSCPSPQALLRPSAPSPRPSPPPAARSPLARSPPRYLHLSNTTIEQRPTLPLLDLPKSHRKLYDPRMSASQQPPDATDHTSSIAFPSWNDESVQGLQRRPKDPHHDKLDTSFFTRGRSFFFEGRVLAVVMSETAGMTAMKSESGDNSDNKSLTSVKYQDNIVYTNVRRFVIVRAKREFAYACPIYTYKNRATAKPGVIESEHSIVYSLPHEPIPVAGEGKQLKPPIPVDMAPGVPRLSTTSRIYFGIVHPIQYNVNVKEIGRVPNSYLTILLKNWKSIEDYFSHSPSDIPKESDGTRRKRPRRTDDLQDAQRSGLMQDLAASSSQDHRSNSKVSMLSTIAPDLNLECETATASRAFFKKGRVFKARWAEIRGSSDELIVHLVPFTVIKATSTFCVCLRINNGPTTFPCRPNQPDGDWIAAVPLWQQPSGQPPEDKMNADKIEIKVENSTIAMSPELQINFKQPYTINLDIKIANIGRVLAHSIPLLEKLFAESLGHVKA